MSRGFRIALATAAVGGALALAGASPANAQVRFRGSFPVAHRRFEPLAHGRFGIGLGDPFFRVGAVVPFGYRVVEDPVDGYGFAYGERWIPVERYGSSWVVCERPAFEERAFAAPRFGGVRFESRFERERFAGRRFERGDRFERGNRFEGRRDGQRDDRRERRDDRRRR